MAQWDADEVLNLKFTWLVNAGNQMSDHVEEGRFFLETVWLRIAMEVIETAIRVYKLDSEQATALREVYGQPRLYTVVLD